MRGKTTALRGKEGREWRRGGTEKGTVRVSRSAVTPRDAKGAGINMGDRCIAELREAKFHNPSDSLH